MMIAFPRVSILLVVALALVGRAAGAAMDEIQAKALAADLVREKMDLDASHPLRVTRKENWEDDLFQIQVKIKGQIAKAAYFFEVTESGYFVLSPDEAVYLATNDGERLWTVAIFIKEGTAYGLYGFRDGDNEFSRLVSSTELDVRSEADAERAALLFFATVRDPRGKRFVSHPRQLRHAVENYFSSKLPEAKAEARAAEWWRGFESAKRTGPLGVGLARSKDGYVATVTYIHPFDNMKLLLMSLKIGIRSTGELETLRTDAIYDPSKSR